MFSNIVARYVLVASQGHSDPQVLYTIKAINLYTSSWEILVAGFFLIMTTWVSVQKWLFRFFVAPYSGDTFIFTAKHFSLSSEAEQEFLDLAIRKELKEVAW